MERDYSYMGRIGAYRLHSLYPPSQTTQAARAKFFQRFEDEVDPHRRLEPADRHARAVAARNVYMLRLALKSAKARRQRAEQAAAKR